MKECYQSQLPTCYTFPYHLNLLRILNSLHGVHKILCNNGTEALKGNFSFLKVIFIIYYIHYLATELSSMNQQNHNITL